MACFLAEQYKVNEFFNLNFHRIRTDQDSVTAVYIMSKYSFEQCGTERWWLKISLVFHLHLLSWGESKHRALGCASLHYSQDCFFLLEPQFPIKNQIGVGCETALHINCPVAHLLTAKIFIQVIHIYTKGAGAIVVKTLSACPHRAGLTQCEHSESQRASEGLRAPVVENS